VSANPSRNSKSAYADDLSIHDDPKGMPLGMGDLPEDHSLDPLAGAGSRKKFNGGSIVLIAVIVMALAGLWFMRALSKVSATTGGSTGIEKTIQDFLKGYKPELANGGTTGTIAATDPTVLSLLGTNFTEQQVPLTDVQRNPFILPGEGEVLDIAPDDPNKALTKKMLEQKNLINKAAARLELKSVIMSAEPLAIVSGKIVRRGDEMVVDPENVAFRVTEITADSVTMVAEDAALDLVVPVKLVLDRDR
jgi:hypothetical protein